MTDRQDLEQLKRLGDARQPKRCPCCKRPTLQDVRRGGQLVMRLCPHCGYTISTRGGEQ